MAERYDFYVHDNRKVTFNLTEPIMREDNHVTDWVIHIPKTLNELEVSEWSWCLVYVNAKGEKRREPLELSDDPESPLERNIGTYSVDYGMSIKAGTVLFAIEGKNADTSGEVLNEWHTYTYEHKVKETIQGDDAEYDDSQKDIMAALIVQVQTKMNQVIGGATPTPVASVSAMTDPSKLYLLTTEGEWYYYNGSAWVSGGVYGAGITDSVPTQGSTNAVSSGGVYSALVDKVSKPLTSPNGTSGQLLRTNGDGTTQWVDEGLPTDAQTEQAVSDWLNEHPEATTTVQDGAVTYAKWDNYLRETVAIHAESTRQNHKGLGTQLHEVSISGVDGYTFDDPYIANGLNLFDYSGVSEKTTNGITATPIGNNAFVLGGTRSAVFGPEYVIYPTDTDLFPTEGEHVTVAVYASAPIRVIVRVKIQGGTFELLDYKVNSNNNNVGKLNLNTNINKAIPQNVIGYSVVFCAPDDNAISNVLVWVGVYHAGVSITKVGEVAELPVIAESTSDKLNTLYYPSTVTYVVSTKEYVDALDVDINNKLTYVTPERFYGGTIPDSVDAYQYILSAINYGITNKLPVYCGHAYKTSQMLDIACTGIDIFINSLWYTGTTGCAIRLSGKRNRVKINYLRSSADGFILHSTASSGDTSCAAANEVDIIRIICDGNSGSCFSFTKASGVTLTGGVTSYNTVKIESAYSKGGNIIYVQADSGANENYIYAHEVITVADYVIHDEYGGNYYHNFYLSESCYCGIHLHKSATLIDFRTTECMDACAKYADRTFLKLSDYAREIKCRNTLIWAGMIDMTDHDIPDEDYEPTATSGHVFGKYVREPVIVVDYIIDKRTSYYAPNGGSNPRSDDLVGGFAIDWNGNAIHKLSKSFAIEVSTATMNMNEQSEANYFNITENTAITLSPSYCPDGIDVFYVNQTNGKKAQVYDSANTLIFDGTEKTDGLYRVTLISELYPFTFDETTLYTLFFGSPGIPIVEKIE